MVPSCRMTEAELEARVKSISMERLAELLLTAAREVAERADWFMPSMLSGPDRVYGVIEGWREDIRMGAVAENPREVPEKMGVLLMTVAGMEKGIESLERRVLPLLKIPPDHREEKGPVGDVHEHMAPLAWEIEQAAKRLLAASMRLTALVEAIEL